jgi:hypothetical protein
MSISFYQTAKNSAGIIFRFGIFLGLWALRILLTCRAFHTAWVKSRPQAVNDRCSSTPINGHRATIAACPLRAPRAEVKWHAITSAMLNDIVQSVLDEVSNYRHGASGAPGIAGSMIRLSSSNFTLAP